MALQVRTSKAVEFVKGVGVSSDMIEGCNYPVPWAREMPYVTVREEIVLKQAQCELTAQGNGIHRVENPSPEMMQQDSESEELLTAGQISMEF